MGQGKVQVLRPRDGIAVDPVQLGELRARMACQHNATAVGNALDELALRLSQIGPAWRDGRFDQVSTCCQAAAEIADCLGLGQLSRVAGAASGLAKGSDGVALAANLGRMLRLGEAVLTTVWDLRDVSR